MRNNDVLRRLRYFLNCNDARLQSIFLLGGADVPLSLIKSYLIQEDLPGFEACPDTEMSGFLNGLIIELRGKKEGAEPQLETYLNNNIILNKLKIAFQFKSGDLLAILELAGFNMSEHELSGFFRKPDHRNFRPCQDQVLRNFLQGLLLLKQQSTSTTA